VANLQIHSLLEKALTARAELFRAPNKTSLKAASPPSPAAEAVMSDVLSDQHQGAFRLFNGFLEGYPELAIDIYAATLVLHNHAANPQLGLAAVEEAASYVRERLPWLRAAIVKSRNSPLAGEKRGTLLFGAPDDRILEHGTWYAIDLHMNQDASLYLDTRNVRKWAIENLKGKSVLNTFAYTGSLGVAALAGGASRVLQNDRSRVFLSLAKASCTLNGFPLREQDYLVDDFFSQMGRLKRKEERFDCIFLDPPFFSESPQGVVDLNRDSARLINKVRPLINDGGWLVAINNALYVSGKEYLRELEALCADGYLRIAELIPVPEDFTGYPGTRYGVPISDPAPFNHSTKIAVLDVRRKKE
jgi:23S rRNA (cytosine1962-C5)-methyltransferase